MRPPLPVPLRAALVAALLLGLLPGPASGDYQDHYKKGLEAAEAGDWPTVEASMKAAIAEEPAAKTRFILRAYTPYYYLGRALFEKGDCEGAVKAWGTSESQGVVQRNDEAWADLQQKRQLCRQQEAARVQAVKDAEAAVVEAEEAAKGIANMPGPVLAPLWESGDPSLAQRAAEARRLLASARSSLSDDAEKVASDKVRELAERATLGFRAIQRDADQMRARLAAERDSAAESLAPVQNRARQALRSAAFLQPYPPRVRRAVSELQALLAASEANAPGATAESLARLGERLGEAASTLERTIIGPPRELLAAAEAYFAADYEQAIQILEEASFNQRRASSQRHLFLAAARFALYVAGGQQDDGLLQASREDVLACREADSRLVPTREDFSPRFVTFFLSQEPDPEAEAEPEADPEPED